MKIEFNRMEFDTDYTPKYHRDDVVTDGKRTYKVLGWDYNERNLPYYILGSSDNKSAFHWLAEDADKELEITITL